MKRGLSYSLAVRRLVREARYDTSSSSSSSSSSSLVRSAPGAIAERLLRSMRLLSTNPQSWIEGWLSSQLASHPPPDVMKKYLPPAGEPATAATIYARIVEVGEGNSGRNKLPRVALTYLLRACHRPEDLVLAKKALELYRLKGVEITEEIALLFVKACCRIGSSPSAAWPPPPHAAEGESEGGEGDGVADADAGDGAEADEAGLALFPFGRSGGAAALATLLDPTMRVGLWSNATAWNYALARLDGKPGSLSPPLPLDFAIQIKAT